MADVGSIIGGIINPNAIAEGAVGFANLLTYIFIGLIFGVGVVIIIWKTKVLNSYPNTALIYKVKNGVLSFASIDHLRTIKDRKTEKKSIEFKSTGKRWTPVTFEAFVQMKKGSLLHLKELGEGDYEIIDPRAFVTGTEGEYRKFENDSSNRFYKNTQDESIRNKYKEESKWKGIIDILPVAILLISIGIAFWLIGQFFLSPLMQSVSPIASSVLDKAVSVLEKSTQVADAQTRYMEVLLKQQGITLPADF